MPEVDTRFRRLIKGELTTEEYVASLREQAEDEGMTYQEMFHHMQGAYARKERRTAALRAENTRLIARSVRAEKALHDIRLALEPVSGEDAYGGIPSLQRAVDAVCRVLAGYGRSDIPVEAER